MNNRIDFGTVRPMIDECFEKGNAFCFKPNGVSMLPFIKGGKTSVEIEKYCGEAKKFDIVFYVRDDGKYVMHRVVKMYDDCYGVCGDNQWWVEKVYDRQIFAIVTSVDGKKKKGGFLYLHTLFLRRFIIHVKKYCLKRMKMFMR